MTARVSSEIIAEVESCLCYHVRRNIPDIRGLLAKRGIVRSDRALRYAVDHLIQNNRARRIGYPRQRWWAFKV